MLGYTDADTLDSILVLSAGGFLSFSAWSGRTTITIRVPDKPEDRQAVEDAAERLRAIVRARELKPLAALVQSGPNKWHFIGLLLLPLAASFLALPLLRLAIPDRVSGPVSLGVVVLSFLPLVLFSGPHPQPVVRLRGTEQPWTERRQGLVALVGGVAAVVLGVLALVLQR